MNAQGSIADILSDDALNAYWSSFDTNVYSAVVRMNEIDEAWSIDHAPKVVKACQELSRRLYDNNVLERMSKGAVLRRDDAHMVLEVMSNLQTARGLRIFRWLEQYQPEFSAELVECASQMSDDRSAMMFLERVRVLNKLNLISRIFAYGRLRAVINQLQDMKDKGVIDQYAREAREVGETDPIKMGGQMQVSDLDDLLNSWSEQEDQDTDNE